MLRQAARAALLGHLLGDAREEPPVVVDVREPLAQPLEGALPAGSARSHECYNSKIAIRRAPVTAVVASAAYLAVMAFWAYGVYDTDRNDVAPGEFWNSWRPFAVLAAFHIATGIVIGRWRALALPVAAVVLAVPAGYAPDGYPELPIWVVLAVQAAYGGLWLLAAGVLARKVANALMRAERPGPPRARGSGPPAASRR